MFNNAKTMRKENKKLTKRKAKDLKTKSKAFMNGLLDQCKVSAKQGSSGVGFYCDPAKVDMKWIYNKLTLKGFSVDIDEISKFIEVNW